MRTTSPVGNSSDAPSPGLSNPPRWHVQSWWNARSEVPAQKRKKKDLLEDLHFVGQSMEINVQYISLLRCRFPRLRFQKLKKNTHQKPQGKAAPRLKARNPQAQAKASSQWRMRFLLTSSFCIWPSAPWPRSNSRSRGRQVLVWGFWGFANGVRMISLLLRAGYFRCFFAWGATFAMIF